MPVDHSKGLWILEHRTGEIRSYDRRSRDIIAVVSGLLSHGEDAEICAANAAIIVQAPVMYNLLIFIRDSLRFMYGTCPEQKGHLIMAIEGLITNVEHEVERNAANHP